MALSKNNPTTQKSWKSLEKIYEQENGEWPADIEIMEELGYLELKMSTKRKWQFDLSEAEITATSLAETSGGEGEVIILQRETGDFRGYGQKQK